MTYGPVDPLETTIRYTTLAAVKTALGITDMSQDTALTQAIVSAEVAIDEFNGRSFPDTGDEPVIDGIPEAIKVWALDASIAVFKMRDTVMGNTGGSDDWIGAVDTGQQVRQALRGNPLALGWKVSAGLG